MRTLFVSALVVVVAAGCDHDRSSGVPSSPGSPATITLTSPSTDPLVSTGDTREISAVVKDANGAILPSSALTWRSSAPAVVSVTGSGGTAVVRAVDDGTATVIAQSGAIEGTIAVAVRRRAVSLELTAPDSVVAAGASMALTVVARDARQGRIGGLTGVTYTTGNPLSVLVSADGVVTALFNPFQRDPTIISATLARDGATITATKQIAVGSAAPATFHIVGLMLSDFVVPEPAPGLGQGIIFFTLDGPRVHFKTLWSLLSGPPVMAHIHGPASFGTVAPVLAEMPLGSPRLSHGVSTGMFTATDILGDAGKPPISLDSLVTLMKVPGATYVDMHTTFLPDGELRGVLNIVSIDTVERSDGAVRW